MRLVLTTDKSRLWPLLASLDFYYPEFDLLRGEPKFGEIHFYPLYVITRPTATQTPASISK